LPQHLARFGTLAIEGSLLVRDTLYNTNSSTSLVITGNVINLGLISYNPQGWGFDQEIGGNIYNLGVWNIHNLTLFSNRPKKLQAQALKARSISFKDTLRLVGDNVISKLTRHGSSPAARVIISPLASLELTERNAPIELENYGKIFWSHLVENNAINNNFNFYKCAIRTEKATNVAELRVEEYEHSLPPGVTNTIQQWWRVLNFPRSFTDTLAQISFTYDLARLNGADPARLQLFYSNNGGLSWVKVTRNLTHNQAQRTFTLTRSPSVGIFALSAEELGVTKVRPSLRAVNPNRGGNYGQVAVQILGRSLAANAKVRLSYPQGGATITADTVMLLETTNELLQAVFTFTGQTPGVLDCIVELPGDTVMKLSAAFTLEPSTGAKPQVYLSGRQNVLINQWQTYTLTYSNIGNVDAKAVPVWLVITEKPKALPSGFLLL
jgi:hypothetical protein